MNKTAKLYRSIKRPKGWGIQPIPDKELKSLKDLPDGGGNDYLAFYEGTRRRTPSVGRFADIAKQKLIQKRNGLDAKNTGVELPPEVESPGSDIITEVKKFLAQQQAFVGNDGYGAAQKSINAYHKRLGFYLRFCAEKHITDLRLGDYDHLMEYVVWLRLQKKGDNKPLSDRYVYNIFSTLGTFALAHDTTVPNKKVLVKLGYAKKVVKAHTDAELELMWAAMTPDEELLYKFFLWSLGREQEVANTEVGDLDFENCHVHICPKRHRQFRLKSQRNRHGNVGDRYAPFHPDLMAKLREYVKREELKEGDQLFPAAEGGTEGHYLRKLQRICKQAKLPFHTELHKLRKTGATLHYNGGKGVPLPEISQWLGHHSLAQTEEYLDVKSTAVSQEHIQRMVTTGRLATHA